MSDFAFASIDKSKIKKISIYVTNCTKTLQQVVTETKADYVLPGTLYDMKTLKVNCHLKSAGIVIAQPNYTVYGYSWGLGSDIALSKIPCAAANYIACTPIILEGKPLPKLTYDKGQGGFAGRMAMGLKGNALQLYCSRDGSDQERTPEQLRDYIAQQGWDNGIMLDGGMSCQCNFAGTTVQSLQKGVSRKCQHWICIWLIGNTQISNDEKRSNVLSVAANEIGVKEQPANSNNVKYNDWFYEGPNHNYAWCMAFIQWVFAHANLPLPVKTASCSVLARYAKTHKQWITQDFKPGDIVFFDWTGNRKSTVHTGIVESVNKNGTVVTIEGNTSYDDQSNGGCVMRRIRSIKFITGAYRPWYNF